jgi:hypothetical protein
VCALAESSLTRNAVRQVAAICMTCQDPKGKVLHLVERGTNETLIPPSLGIVVNPVKFQWSLDERNL